MLNRVNALCANSVYIFNEGKIAISRFRFPHENFVMGHNTFYDYDL